VSAITGHVSPLRLRAARWLVLPILIVAAACDATGPQSALTGLWGGRIGLVNPGDSIALALTQKGSEVTGFGVLTTTGATRSVYDVFTIQGTVARGSVDLSLSRRSPVQSLPPIRLTGTVNRGELSAQETFTGADRPLTLREFRRIPSDLVGTWVMTAISGVPPSQLPNLYDTLIVSADGRAWHSRNVPLLLLAGFGSRAMWERRGSWLTLAHAVSRVPDSLQILNAEMVRLTNGGARTEYFRRVSESTELP
jgi:hypothetical protein